MPTPSSSVRTPGCAGRSGRGGGASAFMATSQGAWAMRSRRHPAPLDPLLPRDTRNHVCHSPGTSTTRDALTSLAPSAGAAGSFDNVAAPLAPPLNGTCPALIVKLPGQVNVMSPPSRSEEPTSELQSLMRISYAVFCL